MLRRRPKPLPAKPPRPADVTYAEFLAAAAALDPWLELVWDRSVDGTTVTLTPAELARLQADAIRYDAAAARWQNSIVDEFGLHDLLRRPAHGRITQIAGLDIKVAP